MNCLGFFVYLYFFLQQHLSHLCLFLFLEKDLPCNISKTHLSASELTRSHLARPGRAFPALLLALPGPQVVLDNLQISSCWDSVTLSWSKLSLCSASLQAKAGRNLPMVTIKNFGIKLPCSNWHLKNVAFPKMPNFYRSTYFLWEFLMVGIFGCQK